MSASPSPDVDALLAHAGWARKLAARLVGDAAAADDLAQDALVVALEHPPAPDRPFRRWLAAVMRNLARQEHRARVRREARERAAASCEPTSSTDELVARLDSHRRLVEAIAHLEEPYRETILLRWFEGRAPREIARVQGVPVATVHTRLQRAHARLAGALDAAHGGDRRAWMTALASLVPEPSALSLVGASVVILMHAKLVLAAAAAAALVVTLSLALRGPSSDAAAQAAPSVDGPAPATGKAPAGAGERVVVTPTTAADQPVATAESSRSKVPQQQVRGRVIDVRGRPVPTLTVRLAAGSTAAPERPVEAVSDERGEFALPALRASGSVLVSSDRWLTVLAGHVPYGPERRVVLVVAERMELAGTVGDDSGQPVAGAELELKPPADLRARLREVLDDSVDQSWRAVSDQQGRFRFAGLPVLEGAKLQASRAGFEPCVAPAPAATTWSHALLMRRARPPEGAIVGTVLDADERPAAGALVSWGGREVTVADDAGRFHLLAPTTARVTVTAVKAGSLPATATIEARAADATPPPLVLRLGGALLSIKGRVVDPAGKPVAAAQVWVDPTWFGKQGDKLLPTESLAARGGWTSEVGTDAQGRFEVQHLLARDYAVFVLEKRTLRVVRREAVPAGAQDVEVVLAEGDVVPRILGRVVDRRGAPVAGVSVGTEREAWCLRSPPGSGFACLMSNGASGPSTKTDADGRFELRRVAREGVSLDVHDASIVPVSVELAERRDLESLVLTVSRRCHFKVELRDPAEADACVLLDGSGQALWLTLRKGNVSTAEDRARLVEGRSEMFTVEETARTLVLYRDQKEVRRVPVELRAGDATILQP